ncbi:MAG: hypothetical protein NC299_14685 [Lachnospiraceae bacterium]|nr:hypothetical protein [Ruminococcus sp.]MCM1276583.1 hypothetical protein [Lachnospiraceae bacterium]
MIDPSVYIPSKFYREFCAAKGIRFTDRERATMINNCGLTLKERLSAFEKIAAETDDDELKIYLEKLVKETRGLFEAFCRAEEGCVYSADDVPFAEFENAKKFAEKYSEQKSYSIDKYTVNGERLGGARFSADGQLIDVWDADVHFPNEFTNRFIPFKNPFERGDIVRDTSGCICVVETSQSEWNDFLKRAENSKSYDFIDASLVVESLSECDYGFMHSHIPPIYLEKLPLNEKGVPKNFDTKNDLEQDLITCVSELMRGETALDFFMSIFLEWREEKIYGKIKSRSWRR